MRSRLVTAAAVAALGTLAVAASGCAAGREAQAVAAGDASKTVETTLYFLVP